jgi:hypothetical protein
MHHAQHGDNSGTQIVDQIAQVAAAVGSATWLGGQVFASAGLHPAVEVLSDPGERTTVVDESWRRYKPIGTTALWLAKTGTAVRVYNAFREPSGSRKGVAAMALACAVGAGVSSALASHFGREVARATPDRATPIQSGHTAAPDTPQRARDAQRWLPWAEVGSIAFGIGLVVSGTLLSAEAERVAWRRHRHDDVPGEALKGGASTWRAAQYGTDLGESGQFGSSRRPALPAANVPASGVSPSAGRQQAGRGAHLPELAAG